jgi:hypothetical protein
VGAHGARYTSRLPFASLFRYRMGIPALRRISYWCLPPLVHTLVTFAEATGTRLYGDKLLLSHASSVNETVL